MGVALNVKKTKKQNWKAQAVALTFAGTAAVAVVAVSVTAAVVVAAVKAANAGGTAVISDENMGSSKKKQNREGMNSNIQSCSCNIS